MKTYPSIMSIENQFPISPKYKSHYKGSVNSNPASNLQYSYKNRGSTGFSSKPIQEKIYVKYSTIDTNNLKENHNLIEKSYMSGSHEESLEENERPLQQIG